MQPAEQQAGEGSAWGLFTTSLCFLCLAACVQKLAALAACLAPPADAQERPAGGSFYAGAHAGIMFGTASATLADPIGIGAESAANPYGALFGGVQGGFEYLFPSRLMLGIEADVN